MAFEKIVVITKKTGLEELIERFNTRAQARFYIEHMGADFAEYEAAHQTYHDALSSVKNSVPRGVRAQFIERAYLPTFIFGEEDLVVTLGPDGLVVNTAKYLAHQPLLALNPDMTRIDGILVAHSVGNAARLLQRALQGAPVVQKLSMACAKLNDGQSLYAVNDLFIGQRTHVSARYKLRHGRCEESQSSSGVIVSTGAGSTGWFRSLVTGAAELLCTFADLEGARAAEQQYQFDCQANYLYFSVREPFVSKVSRAGLVFGKVSDDAPLQITSEMPQNGVIFSDGIESDYLEFNSGAIVRVGVADRKLHLISG